jgi:hypothetical protein
MAAAARPAGTLPEKAISLWEKEHLGSWARLD